MTEKGQLKSLSRNEKQFLARRTCAWCGMPLSHAGCAAIYKACSESTRINRRKKCLQTYEPRAR